MRKLGQKQRADERKIDVLWQISLPGLFVATRQTISSSKDDKSESGDRKMPAKHSQKVCLPLLGTALAKQRGHHAPGGLSERIKRS